MLSKEFRLCAAQCERLARESLDAFARQALTELAAAYRAEAETLERQDRGKRVLAVKPGQYRRALH